MSAGRMLREALEAADVSQALLAYRTSISTKHINQLVQDKAPLSVAVALRIEDAVPSISAEALLVEQVRSDLARKRGRRSSRSLHRED
jgi:plasmid maintenance system antidote protein VapI